MPAAISRFLAFALGCCVLGCGADGPTVNRRTSSAGSAGTGANVVMAAGSAATSNPLSNASPGASAGSGAVLPTAAASGNSNLCEVVRLVANPQTPDMLIVLDRSGSMEDGGRWAPSVSAVRRITMQLQSRIRFGLALFPDPDASGGAMTTVNQLSDCLSAADPQMCLDDLTNAAASGVCAPGKIVVPVAADNAQAIGNVLDMTRPRGGTPTSGTLEQLVDGFATQAAPDGEIHAKYVLLVTDGAPTCPAGEGSETTQPDIDASNAAIEALAARQVRTYVVGYDTTGPGNENLQAVLDGFAQRGGTGDQKHHPVEDEQSLLDTLTSITSAIAGCSFTLDKAPMRADYVLVQLDGQQLNLDAPDGWHLVGDRTIELTGDACTLLQTGQHALSAEVQCSVVEPS